MAGLNYLAFNQDHSLLSVATTRGLRVYNTDPFELTNQTYEEDISLVEQLLSTSLSCLVLTPRLMRIVNTKRHSTICELTFHGMIVAIKMNRKRLVVVLEETIFIYDLSNMKMLHTQLTPLNPAGICAISPNSDHPYLALPHYQKSPPPNPQTLQPSHVPTKSIVKETISGDVLLYDLSKMEEVTVIPAHQTPVSCIAIDPSGTMLATSSEKGTVIRIFALPSGKKLFQFRRGSMPSRIYSMSFNAASTLLCVSSATDTVHIFKLAAPGPSSPLSSSPRQHSNWSRDRSTSPSASSETNRTPTDLDDSTENPSALPAKSRQPNFMSLVRRTSQNVSTSFVSRAAGYLPTSVTEIWEPQRDFAWVKIPRSNTGVPVKSVVAMGNSSPSIMVATSEGGFYVFSVDLENGGEGTLVRRFDDIHGLKHRKGMDGEDQ